MFKYRQSLQILPRLHSLSENNSTYVCVPLSFQHFLDKFATKRRIGPAKLLIHLRVASQTGHQKARRDTPHFDSILLKYTIPFPIAQHKSAFDVHRTPIDRNVICV